MATQRTMRTIGTVKFTESLLLPVAFAAQCVPPRLDRKHQRV
jgi:hypothetical protein